MPLTDSIARPWRQLRQAVLKLGVFNGFLYALSRLLARATGGAVRLQRYLIVAQPIGNGSQPALRIDTSTEVAPTLPDNPLVATFPRPPKIIRARYAGGASCFSATVRSAFAGFIWIQHGAYEEDEVRCRYVLADPECCVWDFDVYVEPRYRFGRTLARLWQAVDSRLAEQGVRWSFSRITVFNPESIAAHSRLGIVNCGSASFLCVGPVQLSVLTTSPFVHLSFSSRQRPLLRLFPPL